MKRFAGSLLETQIEETILETEAAAEVAEFLDGKSKDFIAGYWFAVRHERRNLPTSEDLDRIEREQSKKMAALKRRLNGKLQRIADRSPDTATKAINDTINAFAEYHNAYLDLIAEFEQRTGL